MEGQLSSRDTSVSNPSSGGGVLLAFDTTSRSLLHQLFRGFLIGRTFSTVYLYIFAIGITFLPLVVSTLTFSVTDTAAAPQPALSFWQDWNMLCLLLLAFPCLLILTVTDQHVLSSSVKQVQLDGTVAIAEKDAAALEARCSARFRRLNVVAQTLGAIGGSLASVIAYLYLTPASVGFWIAQEGRLLPQGVVYLYCVFLFYAVLIVYCIRNLAISFLLRDMVEHAQLRLLPLHPDGAGGLRPVGQLGLRNQYVLTILGVNLMLLALTSYVYLDVSPTFYRFIAALTMAYLLLGPVVFLSPLLAFREAMVKTKRDLMTEVAQRLRRELQRIRKLLESESISKEDEELIDRLRKYGGLIGELPVWPFDASTMRKFMTAYVIPLLTGLGYPAVTSLWAHVKSYLIG